MKVVLGSKEIALAIRAYLSDKYEAKSVQFRAENTGFWASGAMELYADVEICDDPELTKVTPVES